MAGTVTEPTSPVSQLLFTQHSSCSHVTCDNVQHLSLKSFTEGFNFDTSLQRKCPWPNPKPRCQRLNHGMISFPSGEVGEWGAGGRAFHWGSGWMGAGGRALLFIQHFMVPCSGLSSCHLSSHSMTVRTVAWARASQPYFFGDTKVQGGRLEGKTASSWQAQRSPRDLRGGLWGRWAGDSCFKCVYMSRSV